VTGEAGGQLQHVVGSPAMLTTRDPWNNILRGTLACFAASAGGADAITVTAFDAAIGQPGRLGRRVARNVHAVLAEESHIARVIDPAGGSWYVEDLTEQLAARAWACFQDIERAGGLRAALVSGLLADQLAASRETRRDDLARRRTAVTGVSQFPLAGETLLDRPPSPVLSQAGGLPRIRWAQWHETLRDRADAYARAAGSPPTVTLALADAARATAAQAGRVAALLAPAGIATVTASPDAAAGGAPGAAVVVVCGSTETSPGEVGAAIDQARANGASVVIAAAGGPPPPGADGAVTGDTDVLELSGQILAALGVA
jgi:methylmalonyl-CoA mutase